MKHLVVALSICVMGGIFLGAAVAEAELNLRIYPEEMELERYLRVWGSLHWDSRDALTDVYLAVIDEAGSIRFICSYLSDPLVTPIPYISTLFVTKG